MEPCADGFPLLVLLAGAIAPDVSAQVLRKERYPALGLPTVYRPRTFDVVPVQPNEPWIRLQWFEELPDERKKYQKRRNYRPRIFLVDIPRPEEEPETADEPEGERRSSTKRKRRPVVDLPSWLENEYPKWQVADLGPGRKSREFSTHVFGLTSPEEDRGVERRGIAYEWSDATRTVAIIAICATDDFDELEDVFMDVGEKLEIGDPKGLERERKKLERQYLGRHSHPEYRMRVAAAAVDPWKVDNTDNYIFVYNTPDQPLLRKIKRDIEAMREVYMELFPPAKDFDAVSTVRICADQSEYLAYGGMRGSAGYWNSSTEELVLYHYEVQDGGRADDANTFIVLYHEAFHQYIHYSSGELPPHSWFNEGYGDFFSGALLRGGKVRKLDVNPWRCGTIQRAIELGRDVPWRDIIEYSQMQYYANPAICYAQGWSMIYFLNRSSEVERRPEWAKILPTYFETLKSEYQARLAELRGDDEDERDITDGQRFKAGEEARRAALAAAFQGVDLDEIHRAWADFTLELEDPRD